MIFMETCAYNNLRPYVNEIEKYIKVNIVINIEEKNPHFYSYFQVFFASGLFRKFPRTVFSVSFVASCEKNKRNITVLLLLLLIKQY